FSVQITLPKSYVVAATGELQDSSERLWLRQLATAGNEATAIRDARPVVSNKTTGNKKPPFSANKTVAANKRKPGIKNPVVSITRQIPKTKEETKTLNYVQNDVHDFAWFADKNY